MNCRDFDRTWNDRLDARGEPPEAEGLALEAHAAECPACRALAVRYRTLRQCARGLGTTSGRPGRVRGPVPRTPGRRRGPPRLAGPGVACLVDPARRGGVLVAGGLPGESSARPGWSERSPDRPPRRASRRPPLVRSPMRWPRRPRRAGTWRGTPPRPPRGSAARSSTRRRSACRRRRSPGRSGSVRCRGCSRAWKSASTPASVPSRAPPAAPSASCSGRRRTATRRKARTPRGGPERLPTFRESASSS